MNPHPALVQLAHLWSQLSEGDGDFDDLKLTDHEPGLPSSFRVGLAAQLSIAAVALAARALGHERFGLKQTLSVDSFHAAIECRSERLLRIDGKAAPELWDAIAGIYRCRNGRYLRLHSNFAHHRAGIVKLLACRDEQAAIAEALLDWDGEAFETRATDAGLVVAYLRTFEEWDRHPQRAALAIQPLIDLEKLGDAPLPHPQPGTRPLDDLRVLEMTRIIAAPIAGRVLAAHGADVLRFIAPGLPTIAMLDIDSGRGKRSTFLDIATPDGRARFSTLLGQADIFLQSYRPGVLEGLGFDWARLVAIKPGIIIGSLSAYGRIGPWAGKRGFDSLVQAATGFNLAEGEAAGDPLPRPLPMQILDHASGYLLAFGLLMARRKQRQEGGSWKVEVSLARTAQWLRDMGRLDNSFSSAEPDHARLAPYLEETPSAFGRLTTPRHAAQLGLTPALWKQASTPYGSDEGGWRC